MKAFVGSLGAITALVSYGTAVPAAQAADEALQEVVVTAERRETALLKTPISVSAFTATGLQDRQITRIADLQRFVPSLSVATGTVDPTTLTIFMRGAGQNAGTWVGYESAVGLYVDDLYFARLTGANLDLADFERVEVLRGPQGTLYGRNTLVGAIKYITKKPSVEGFGNLTAEYGNLNLLRVKGTISGGLSPSWAGLVTANYYTRDGYSKALALNKNHYGDREEYGLRAALEYVGDGPVKASLSAFHSHAVNDGTIGLGTSPQTLVPATSNIYDYISPIDGLGGSDVSGGSLTLSYVAGAATLKSITGVVSGTQDIFADTTGGRPTVVAGGPYLLGFDRLVSDSKQTQYSQEFQILGDAAGDRLHYIGGLYYFREKGFQNRQDFLLSSINTLPQHVDMRTTSYAGYGQLTYDFTDTLSVVGGLRWSHEKKSVDGRTQNGIASTAYAAITGETTAEALTPKLGVNWQLSDATLIYGSASRGFQAGGFNYLAVVNPVAYRTAFKPQTVWAYELGVKTQFLDGRGRVSLALYNNEFSDIQTNVTVPGGSSLTQNAGKARVRGVEAEISASPVDALTVYATLSYGNGKYTRIDPNSDAARANARFIPNVPKWQGGVGVNGNVAVSRGKLLYGADYSYIADKYLGGTNAPITLMPSYDLVSAFVGFKPTDSRFEVRASIANALKEKFYVYGNVIGGTYGIRSPGEPQTYKLTLNYQY